MAKLWEDYDGEAWLDNPRRRRRGRRHTARRRHHRNPESRRTRRAAARKGHRRHVMRMNPRHRRHHRNPFGGGMTRGIMGRVMEGVKGGAGVVVGEGLVGAIPGFVGQTKTSIPGILIQVGAGVILAPFADKVLRGFGKPFLYGAFAGPIRSAVIRYNVPVLAPALSSYNDVLRALPVNATVKAIQGARTSFAAYQSGLMDEEDGVIVQ